LQATTATDQEFVHETRRARCHRVNGGRAK